MPTVQVYWYEGRTQEQKKELAVAITEAVARIGKIPPEATHVIYHDMKKSDWAQGGVMASER